MNAPPGYDDIIRRLLVLGADHELDPSTYALRAIANTGVSPYRIALAGLAAAVGRRLTFGRAQAISQMFTEIMTIADPREAILRRLQEGEPVYGFHSRRYPKGDPRAAALLRWLNDATPDDPDLQRLNLAIEAVHDVTGDIVDFVIPLSFIGFKLGLVVQEGLLLRLARMAGLDRPRNRAVSRPGPHSAKNNLSWRVAAANSRELNLIPEFEAAQACRQ